MKQMFVLGMALMLALPAMAQKSAESEKTTVNADGTVTFRYRNDQARRVSVDVQFAGKHDMVRDAGGVWTATLGPAASDMYPYHFEVDGLSIMDPQCDQYFPNEGFKNSLLEIPGRGEALPHDIRPVPHGSVEYVHYYSGSLQYTNNAVVYLPPTYYEQTDKRYPVFYLISGTTDTEEVYYKVGRVNYILDNLIADGKALEMIVVLPYGNPNKLLPVQPDKAMPMTNFGADVFSNDLVGDLLPYIDTNYRTLADRDHRAIGGFSRGGNQGLSNGLHNLDKFSYLCSYSSFTSTDIPGVYDNARDTNRKIHLFWLGVGTDDFLYGNARDYTEFLDQKGIRCVKEYTHDKFGHTWMNAKYFLSKTLPLLFNPKASARAMKAALPTRAKTGNEQQFTPGVMARLFPRSIVSPEYRDGGITFSIKAPEAQQVQMECELLTQPINLQRDSDGVWSTRIVLPWTSDFKYCYLVDGTRVADPVNMYLSPDRGFKYSICKVPQTDMGQVQHGVVENNYAEGTACYHAAGRRSQPTISLVPGPDDTVESWFAVGGAAELADRLAPSTAIYVGPTPLPGTQVLRAADYQTWPQRTEALRQLLTNNR